MHCPGCGYDNAPGARFCNQCGAALAGGEARPAPAEAERKQVSVLFSDLTGFTALSERLDPEETREILGGIFERAADVVGRYDGRIEKFVGDAIMALFGVPQAHEDDPVRAVRAALELHEAVAELAPSVEARTGAKIAMHSGVNTGIVVTGELQFDRGTAGPLGDTINVAARLMGLAEPGEILVGPETRRLVGRAVEIEDLGERQVKGKAEPVAVARVRGRAASSAEAPRTHGAFVGRQEELGILLGAIERLRDGEGGVIAIQGDAGTGKTRLLDEMRSRVGGDVRWLEGRAYLYAESTPYFPLVDLLNRAWGISEGDSTDGVRQKVETGVTALVDDPGTVLPVIARLYDIALPGAPVVDRETWQERLLEALRELLAAMARRGPTVVCLQDLHWADASSATLLRALARDLRVPVLLIANHRPGFVLGEDVRTLELRELSARQTGELLSSLLEGAEPPAALAGFVEQRSDGNPFYVEEVIQSLLETGVLTRSAGGWTLARPLSEAEVPPSIRGVIAARIDRLDDSLKRVLREAAVVGREFLYDVIAQVSVEQEELSPRLDDLETADLIRTKSRTPDLEYIFKHALTQEVAYDGLLRTERQKLHERTGYALERLLGQRAGDYVETLAWHFQRGGVTDKAVYYLVEAGKKSIERYALGQATTHFREAFALLAERERSPAEDRALIQLLVAWSLVHYYLGTFVELRTLLHSNEKVAARLGDPELEGFYRGWLGLALSFHEDGDGAVKALDRALELGEAARSDRLVAYAQTWRCWALWPIGRCAEAIAAGEAAHALADRFPEDHYAHFKPLAGIGFAAAAAGDLERARQIGGRLLEYAEKTGNARAAVAGHTCLAMRHLLANEPDHAIAAGRAACAGGRDPLYGEWGTMYEALAGAMGRLPEVSRPGVERLRRFSAECGVPWWDSLARFADSLTRMAEGEFSAGMHALFEEEHVATERGARFNALMARASIALTYAMIAQREVSVPLGRLLSNPRFLLRHALPARRKAITRLRSVAEESEAAEMKPLLGRVHLELARLLAPKDRAEARAQVERAIEILAAQGAERELARAREVAATLLAVPCR